VSQIDDVNGTTPPVGEEIHMPAPSVLPLVNAAALSLGIVCITLSWVLVIFFGIIFGISTIKWIADTRRDIAALPLDHSSH
jgi:hypothetical protein